MIKWKFLTLFLLISSLVFVSCDTEEEVDIDMDQDTTLMGDTSRDAHRMDTSYSNLQRAVAELNPTEGNNVRGIVTFTKVDGGIRVVADVENLTPGKHGFHIHEKGDCSAPDASSAGGHFAPQNHEHGSLDEQQSHAGDFGNLEAGADGRAHAEFTTNKISFTGPNSIIDKGLIVHADEDDLETQPTGNAGARVACGVIKPHNMETTQDTLSSTTTDVYQ